MITQDFSEFDKIDLNHAAILLKIYAKDKSILGNGVNLFLNTSSGEVYLQDENENKAVANLVDEKIELVWKCPDCGYEGFEYELIENQECCKKFVESRYK